MSWEEATGWERYINHYGMPGEHLFILKALQAAGDQEEEISVYDIMKTVRTVAATSEEEFREMERIKKEKEAEKEEEEQDQAQLAFLGQLIGNNS